MPRPSQVLVAQARHLRAARRVSGARPAAPRARAAAGSRLPRADRERSRRGAGRHRCDVARRQRRRFRDRNADAPSRHGNRRRADGAIAYARRKAALLRGRVRARTDDRRTDVSRVPLQRAHPLYERWAAIVASGLVFGIVHALGSASSQLLTVAIPLGVRRHGPRVRLRAHALLLGERDDPRLFQRDHGGRGVRLSRASSGERRARRDRCGEPGPRPARHGPYRARRCCAWRAPDLAHHGRTARVACGRRDAARRSSGPSPSRRPQARARATATTSSGFRSTACVIRTAAPALVTITRRVRIHRTACRIRRALLASSARSVAPRARAARVATDSHWSRDEIARELGSPLARIAVVRPEPDAFWTPGPAAPLPAPLARTPLRAHRRARANRARTRALAVEACARAFRAADETLVVVGELPPTRRGARARARLAVRQDRRERRDAARRSIDSARVVLVPSTAEGFGLVAVEALACGAAVLASDASALPEATDGAAPLLDPHDVDAWARAIRDVFDDDARADALRRHRARTFRRARPRRGRARDATALVRARRAVTERRAARRAHDRFDERAEARLESFGTERFCVRAHDARIVPIGIEARESTAASDSGVASKKCSPVTPGTDRLERAAAAVSDRQAARGVRLERHEPEIFFPRQDDRARRVRSSARKSRSETWPRNRVRVPMAAALSARSRRPRADDVEPHARERARRDRHVDAFVRQEPRDDEKCVAVARAEREPLDIDRARQDVRVATVVASHALRDVARIRDEGRRSRRGHAIPRGEPRDQRPRERRGARRRQPADVLRRTRRRSG